jgi:dTDP-4-dehydrorhamnose reductase
LITGGGGMVATDLRALLEQSGTTVSAPARGQLDIASREAVDRVVDSAQPQVIVNCAAWTRVDDAEAHEESATRVNGEGVEYLADAANRHGALLVQISTDFVFDGTGRRPYEPDDPVGPVSAYGRSKLAGERAAASAREHLIVRTSWLFGRSGWNFVEAMRKQVDVGRTELRVVNDQRGCPTYTPHLASAIVALCEAGARGIVHYADRPECTWFDFAAEIIRQLGAEVKMVPVTTAEFPRPAARPAYSVLSTAAYERITGRKPESWVEGLREYLQV